MEFDALRLLPGYPYTAWILVGLVAVIYLARLIRTERPMKQSTTNARFGGRLERVERELRMEQLRRVQVEHELIRSGLVLPLWPTDPDQPDPRPLDVDVDVDQADVDAYPETAQRIAVPPLGSFPRHRRSAP